MARGRALGALAACAIVCCSAGFRFQTPDPRTWTVEQWIVWRDAQIQRILEPTFASGGEVLLSRRAVIDRSAEAYAVIAACSGKDPEFFSLETPRGKAMGHFVQFVAEQQWMAVKDADREYSHALGFELPDTSYYESVARQVELPPLLRSQLFLRYMSDPATYRAAVDLIERHNASLPGERRWIVLPFVSQFILSADRSTYGRLLVVVPNDPITEGGLTDKWIMFAIATPGASGTPVRSVSVVTVRRPLADGAASRAFLMDFMRESSPVDGVVRVVPAPFAHDDPSNSCYDCHKSAVMPIHPGAQLGFDTSGRLMPETGRSEVVDRIDERIRSYQAWTRSPSSVAAYGPGLGATGVERSSAFIREASGLSLSPESVARIRDAMNCGACHDKMTRINYPQAVQSSRDVMGFKGHEGLVRSYIENGWMPPDNTLTTVERQALWRCLFKEYFDPAKRSGLLMDWLKG